MRPRKYKLGQPYRDPSFLIEDVTRQKYVMLHGRPCHPSFVVSMKLNTILNLLRQGAFVRADINHGNQ